MHPDANGGVPAPAADIDLRKFVDRLLRFDTTEGREADAQAWFRGRLEAFGFETFEWTADAERLAEHPSFPDDPDRIAAADRPSVGGVLEFGDPDAGRTLLLNGHVDVVPAERDDWDADPFEPVRAGGEQTGGDESEPETLTARGAADMKSGLSACVAAALDLRTAVEAGEFELDGRVVVESVVGEEEGGIGAAAAALDNPYPFERDAAIVAEPTELTPVIAVEGSLMARLRLRGTSAHAATRWAGTDVLDQFERIRAAFLKLESERGERLSHPLYEAFPVPLPVVCGTVEAGSWASTVPAALESEWRIGVAPGETVDEAEAVFRERLEEVVADDGALAEHPPEFERFSVQFESAEIAPDAPVVESLRAGMAAVGLEDDEPRGATYGADSRHYVAAGVPAVLFGPGTVEQAHYPNERIDWADVETARTALAAAAVDFLSARD